MTQSNEFEIKIKSNNDMEYIFENIFKYCNDTYTLLSHEKTVNHIANIQYNKTAVKRVLYNDKCQILNDNGEYYIKETIASKFVKDAYEYNNKQVSLNLTHATEKIIRNYIMNECLYRIKDRLSYLMHDNWRIDLTLVKKTTDYAELNLLIPKFFKNYNIKNYMDRKGYIDSYEIEIEYIGMDMLDLNILKDKSDYLLSFLHIYKNQLIELNYLLTDTYSHTKLTFQDIMNQAITLDKYQYYKHENNLYLFDNYLITEKLDGERVLLFIINSNMYLIHSNKKIHKKINISNTNITMALDCEYFNNDENDKNDQIYIFDVLYYNKTKVINIGYVERIKYFENCKQITDQIKDYDIKYKDFEQINNTTEEYKLETLVHKFYTNKISEHNIDGIIISEPNNSYYNTNNYKWKPVEYNTIDFYCKYYQQQKVKDKIIYKYKIYVKVNINYKKKINIDTKNILKIESEDSKIHLLFTPSLKHDDYIFESNLSDIDDKIVELKKNMDTWKWELVKIRTDKKTANHLFTAEQIYMNYYNPLTIEMLYNANDLKAHYFKTSNTNVVIHFKDWNNNVKKYIFEHYLKGTKKLLDLGAGRGADINKYCNYNIQEVIMADNDIMALHEIVVDRKKNITKNSFSPKIHVVKLDLTSNYLLLNDNIVNQTNVNKVDGILISMAIHYFAFADTLLLNLIEFINLILEPGGLIAISLLNGKKVYELLKKNNGEWKVSPNKFYIDFENKNIQHEKYNKYTGINIKLPFSNDELYTEKLMDVDYIIRVFKKNKMYLELSKSFLEFDIKNVNLDNDDKQYVDLHHMLLFRKKK
jgi:hypothetical protein